MFFDYFQSYLLRLRRHNVNHLRRRLMLQVLQMLLLLSPDRDGTAASDARESHRIVVPGCRRGGEGGGGGGDRDHTSASTTGEGRRRKIAVGRERGGSGRRVSMRDGHYQASSVVR